MLYIALVELVVDSFIGNDYSGVGHIHCKLANWFLIDHSRLAEMVSVLLMKVLLSSQRLKKKKLA